MSVMMTRDCWFLGGHAEQGMVVSRNGCQESAVDVCNFPFAMSTVHVNL